ncbi:MAG: glycosyltransferase [Ignavibacteriaceae bacterium]|nr:glycosyltransferase [Ignavibacteriaceae bacterium]
MTEKYGIGIVTYNRVDYFENLLLSLPDIKNIVVVNDGNPYPESIYAKKNIKVIQHKRNKGVGRSKNDAMSYLINKGCEHIFILEDDILIKDGSIFDDYIRASKLTGLQHFNFAFHGPLNKTENGEPAPRAEVSYNGEKILTLNQHIPGALSYFTKGILEKTGLIDVIYYNAWEHVDLSTRIFKLLGYSPFWWFADIAGSNRKIKDQDEDLKGSSIRKNNFKFMLYFRIFSRYYRLKHGHIPYRTPDEGKDNVRLKLIESFKLYRPDDPVPEIKIEELRQI